MTKVYIDELEDKGNELINYSQNNIKETICNLKASTNNLIWDGPGYQSYISQFNSKINKLEKINNNLSKIASYLITAKDEYYDTNIKIDKMYEELLEEYKEIENE